MIERRFVDFHIHSTASDGTTPAEEVVLLADREKLAAIALTDHDTLEGIPVARAAAAQCPELKFLAGIEVSAVLERGTLHILGLGIDENAQPISSLAQRLRDSRNERNPKIIRRLQEMGFDISIDEALAVAAGNIGKPDAETKRRGDAEKEETAGNVQQEGASSVSVSPRLRVSPSSLPSPLSPLPSSRVLGRLHIAEAMLRKGYVKTRDEAFAKYIGSGGPAFVDKEKLSPREVIADIRDSGGVAVLAHPIQLKYDNSAQLERMVRELIDAGLQGIEAYHSDHSDSDVRLYLDLARRYGLAVSGGSDFHGRTKPTVMLGRPRVTLSAITGLLAEKLGKTED